jgi:predicted esterase
LIAVTDAAMRQFKSEVQQVLITHGTADTLIPLELSEKEVKQRCALGENVQLARLPGVGHDARNESGVLTVGWIEDRFAERPPGNTCDVNSVKGN